jgi:DNA mismatch repair ATPase MutL
MDSLYVLLQLYIYQVEDLFYTMPNRKRALRSVSEEYNRLLAVAQQYAIHNAGVSISIKKVIILIARIFICNIAKH